jgi:hypothetical protein
MEELFEHGDLLWCVDDSPHVTKSNEHLTRNKIYIFKEYNSVSKKECYLYGIDYSWRTGRFINISYLLKE